MKQDILDHWQRTTPVEPMSDDTLYTSTTLLACMVSNFRVPEYRVTRIQLDGRRARSCNSKHQTHEILHS